MRVLDLFCGAGGASTGYVRAGHEVVGVDLNPMPRYPYSFVQADALEYLLEHGYEFDLIHASPPCQAHSPLQHRWGDRDYPDLIAATRDLLIKSGRPYVIENVPGAPLRSPLMLCGSMFDLRVIRHRLFETSPQVVFAPATCSHPRNAVGRHGHFGDREWITVAGHFSGVPKAQVAMGGLTWMTQHDLAQAIPPAYTQYVVEQIAGQLIWATPAATRGVI